MSGVIDMLLVEQARFCRASQYHQQENDERWLHGDMVEFSLRGCWPTKEMQCDGRRPKCGV